MEQELREKMIAKARENGNKHGKTAELDFGAGAEWMHEQLVKNCFIPNVSNCAFQYYNGIKVVCDEFEITLEEAKELWNKHYDDMVEKTTEDLEIEVAIWINMKDSTDYRETLIHLSKPEVKDGKLYEPRYIDKF